MQVRASVSLLIFEQFNSQFPALLSWWFEKFLIIPRVNISLVGVCDLDN
jgi:hypothetical protein